MGKMTNINESFVYTSKLASAVKWFWSEIDESEASSKIPAGNGLLMIGIPMLLLGGITLFAVNAPFVGTIFLSMAVSMLVLSYVFPLMFDYTRAQQPSTNFLRSVTSPLLILPFALTLIMDAASTCKNWVAKKPVTDGDAVELLAKGGTDGSSMESLFGGKSEKQMNLIKSDDTEEATVYKSPLGHSGGSLLDAGRSDRTVAGGEIPLARFK